MTNRSGRGTRATFSAPRDLTRLASGICWVGLSAVASAQPTQPTQPAPFVQAAPSIQAALPELSAQAPLLNPLALQSCTPAESALRVRRGLPQSRVRRDPQAPVQVEADRFSGSLNGRSQAEGRVMLRQGGIVLRADRLSFDKATGEVQGQGESAQKARAERGGDVYLGQWFSLNLNTEQGYVLDPEYYFGRNNAGGRATRIDIEGPERATIHHGDYTSCPRDEARGIEPAWVLKSDRVRLDFAANEGVAEGAVLRFLGVPILAVPALRFPVTDERKSGWLPPNFDLDNKKGVELGVPYYWNIAPNHDATFVPTIYSRRGLALGSEFRYLRSRYDGLLQSHWLPNDRVEDGHNRHALVWNHRDRGQQGARFDVTFERVSDDRYWKDFPRQLDTLLTPRLLMQSARGEVPLTLGPLQGTAYARVQHWQVLQDEDPLSRIVAPYQRSPQVGWRASRPWRSVGANVVVETELNHFTKPSTDTAFTPQPLEGWRAHALLSASRRFGGPGWWVEPGLKLNAAAYRTDTPMVDGRRNASRWIPTASVDSGMVFERMAPWFGREYVQTFEPRLTYVNTARRDQSTLPNFDAAGTDFNVVSIFSDNAFSGIDRVSDTHQFTAGATSRWLDARTGAERLRLGLVQRYLLRDQRITPDGVPVEQRFSDVLLFGQANQNERWGLSAALQYNPESERVTRSVIATRYSPGPYRTVGIGYRLIRNASEQIDLGWQWPLYGPGAQPRAPGAAAGLDSPLASPLTSALNAASRDCRGTLYGVGRVNYSYRDSRLTDAVLGLEYDAGCWIGRLVFHRLSTGRAEATKRLSFQLELSGLSRLGVNPLRVLKDNVPGYRLLREDAAPYGPPPVYE